MPNDRCLGADLGRFHGRSRIAWCSAGDEQVVVDRSTGGQFPESFLGDLLLVPRLNAAGQVELVVVAHHGQSAGGRSKNATEMTTRLLAKVMLGINTDRGELAHGKVC